MAKMASLNPVGNGGARRWPFTKCRSGIFIGLSRTGSASSWVRMVAPLRATITTVVPAPHFSQVGIAFSRCGVATQSVPLGTDELTERIAHGEAHADPIGTELL